MNVVRIDARYSTVSVNSSLRLSRYSVLVCDISEVYGVIVVVLSLQKYTVMPEYLLDTPGLGNFCAGFQRSKRERFPRGACW